MKMNQKNDQDLQPEKNHLGNYAGLEELTKVFGFNDRIA
jgi:hypothetical protein